MPLDQVICTSPMIQSGAASVQAMDGVFKSAPGAIQQQFQSAHDSILSQFNAVYSWYSDWIPLGNDCWTISDLGNQADQLTNNMQVAMGQAPTPGKPAPSWGLPDLSSLSGVLVPAAVILALVFVLSRR